MPLAEIGLGSWPLASPFSIVNERDAREIVQTFLGMGGQFIDTAPSYDFGEVERRLGRILREFPRDEYYLASKCGYVWDENKRLSLSGRYDDVISVCENSLFRLGVDTLDLYFSHFPDPVTPFAETMGAMVDLQEQGKIKEIGVSNVDLAQLKEYAKHGPVSYIQNRFSLLDQSMTPDFVDFCLRNGIGVTAVNVINRGLLTDKFVTGISLREGDQRHQRREFDAEVAQVVIPWIRDTLIPLADRLGTSISSLAIWWALQQPAVALCICGATKVSQVASNIEVVRLELPSEATEEIYSCYEVLADSIERQYSTSIREFMGLMPMTVEAVLRAVRGQ